MFEALEGWQGLDGFAGLLLGEADLIKALLPLSPTSASSVTDKPPPQV